MSNVLSLFASTLFLAAGTFAIAAIVHTTWQCAPALRRLHKEL